MAVFIDPRTGERYENVPDDQAARARSEFGLVPEADYQHSQEVEQAGEGTTLQAAGEAAQRVVGGVAEGIQRATGFGTAPGLDEVDDQGTKLPGGGLESLRDAYSPEARLRREAHPLAAGIGTGLAVAPAAGLAAAGAAAALPGATIPLLGGSAAGLATESAVQAAAQEYDDAWFEQRPFELQQVAAKTLMFATGDLLFRGALQGGKRLLFGAPKESAGLGRNIISEAQGAARDLSPELAPAGGGGSVGAARAADLSEPFDDAIRSMSDKDAAVLARDAEDHLHLVSQNASEAFTRVNQGLTDSLGARLKYEDFATNAQSWDAPLLERQAKWLDGMVEQGDDVAREIAAFAEGNKASVDFGNLGRKAVKLIDGFNTRLAQETDPARRNWMVDNLKKEFDGLTMSIDASFGVDDVTRSDLKGLIAPYREALRKGLENPKYWGENAELQRSLNAPWHTFLKDWPAVQRQVLEATGNVQFDQMGAGRIGRESTVDRMLSLLGKDPRSNQEFGRHLAGALDGLQGLIEARQARGIAGTEGLEAMAADVRNLMEDWNLATTVGVAKNRVAIMQRDPRKWASLALDLGERLPIVGKPIQVGRNLGEAFTDLHLKQGTPLAAVWERGYQRYAKNPAFADPSIARNYADWVIDALRGRGGAVPPPGAAGAPAAPMANDVMTGAPGFQQAAQPAAEGSIFSPRPESDAAARIRAKAAARANQAGYVVLGKRGPLVEAGDGGDIAKLRKELSETLARIKEADAAGASNEEIDSLYAKWDALEDQIRNKADPTSLRGERLQELQKRVDALPKVEHDKLPFAGSQAQRELAELAKRARSTLSPEEHEALKSYTGQEYEVLRSIENGTAKPSAAELEQVERLKDAADRTTIRNPTRHGPLYRGLSDLPVEAIDELMAHDEFVTAATTSSSYNPDIAKGFASGRHAVMFKIDKADLGSIAAVTGGEREVMLPAGQKFRITKRERLDTGPLLITVEQAGHASRRDLEELGALGFAETGIGGGAAGIASSPLGVAAGAGALGLGAHKAYQLSQDRPPPPAQAPEHAYRDALREISQAGDAQIASLASSVLRARGLKPGKKGPLELFAGRRSLDDAVDSARQRLGALAGDPSQLVKELAGSVGDLAKTHPAVYSALVAKAAQITQYLRASLDPPAAVTLMDPRGGKLSFDRAWDFAARTVGAAYPRTALKEIARGTAPPEMIEAVRQNWPELWEPFRAELLGQVQRMASAGKHLPSEKLLRLDRQLGMDGQLDPSASMAVAAHFIAAQDAEQAKRQQAGQAGGGRALSSSSGPSYRTTLDTINSERALQ